MFDSDENRTTDSNVILFPANPKGFMRACGVCQKPFFVEWRGAAGRSIHQHVCTDCDLALRAGLRDIWRSEA